MFHRKTLSAAVCALAVALAPRAPAGDAPHPLNPADQPLAVVRADTAETVRDILRTRQAEAFGLDGKDFSGVIPDTDVPAESLQGFLAALVGDGAENLWHAVVQNGGTLARRTGGFGWEAREGGGAAGTLNLADAAVETLPGPSGTVRTVVARDRETMEALVGGGRASPWRTDLAKFLSRREGMAGVLANSRPLFGFLSLFTGADFRGAFAECGLNVPASVQLELFANGGDLGFEARLNNLFPEAPFPESAVRREVLSFKKDPLLEVNVSAPELLRRHIPFDTGFLVLANLDANVLLPQAINLTLWRNPDGSPAWAAVCLVPDREAFRLQLRRVHAWLDALAASGAKVPAVEEATAPSGQPIRVFRAGREAFAAGLAEGEGRSGYFIVSGTIADWPDPRSVHRQAATAGRLMQYRSVLDAASRREAAKTLSALLLRRSSGTPGSAWERALPEKDSGYLAADGESLVLMSRNGLLPLLAPMLPEFLHSK